MQGLRSLDWLIDAQTSPDGHLSPIGNGWWPRGGDDVPVRPAADRGDGAAPRRGSRSRGDRRRTLSRRRWSARYAWFLGANDLGLYVADPARGAGCDGLTPTGVNTNQGAESTLMWLIAAEHIRAFRDARAASRRPAAQLLAMSTR